ncbi:regulator of sigma E protease, partial [Trypanosoma cruzi]
MYLHAEAPQCRMHGSTEMCLLRVPRIRRVVEKRVQSPRRGLIPRHRRKVFSLQITASISLTSSTGSVMGKMSIGRFADIYGYSPNTNRGNTGPTCKVWQKLPMRRACSNIHSCSVRSTSSAAAHSTNSFTSASAPPSPTSPSCSPGQPV